MNKNSPTRKRYNNFRRKAALGVGIYTGAQQLYNSFRQSYKPQPSAKKRLHQSATVNAGNGGSFSKFFYGRRRLPRGFRSIKKALAYNYKVYNATSRVTAAVGSQTADTVTSMFNVSDCKAISAAITANPTQKFMLSSCSAELMITNCQLSNVRITLYDIIARRDVQSATIQNPDQAWSHSYLDEGGANANWAVVGTTPFSADTFTQYYKVLKMTHILLGQGQTHIHRMHFAANRQMDDEFLNYQGYAIKGLTCFTMVVASGMPENDSVTVSQISTAIVNLDCIIRKQYKYTWLADASTTYSVTNTLPSAFTVASHMVDEGSGTVVSDATA